MKEQYKLLSNYKKANMIFKNNFSFIPARELCVVYLKSLRSNNRKVIDHFESFGEDVNSMIFKKMDFDQELIYSIEKENDGQYSMKLK